MGSSNTFKVSLLCSSVYFLLPGDQEVGRKVQLLEKAFFLFKSTKN